MRRVTRFDHKRLPDDVELQLPLAKESPRDDEGLLQITSALAARVA